MKYLSLFTGIGGFELGIQKAYENNNRLDLQEQTSKNLRNGESDTKVGSSGQPTCIGYSEIDKYATQIYQKHFPEHKNYGSVRDIDAEQLPDFNLLVGGFPCQAFSIAGKRKGFEDARGTLFYDIARIAKTKQPMFMLLENVKGLVSHDKGKTLEVILESLQELGYYVNYEIRNSKDYGVPQNRERIFFLCKHIKLLSSVGQNEKITTSENIIQEWLFQLLLNNLAEVKKLQEHSSKDWVVGYLLLKEINQNLNQSEENILDGISTVMAEKSSLFEVNPWQSIDTWLSKNLAENFSEVNKYTISTAINEIIESKTYSFSAMLKSILLATVLLRKSSENLWKKTLLDLILIQENTKYARINNKGEEIIVTESGITHISSELQDFEKYFIVGHLRGTSRPEVFPIIGTDTEDTRNVGEDLSYALDANYHKGTNTLEKGRRQLIQLNNPTHSNDRVYEAEGISPTLNTMQGGNRQPKIISLKNRRTEHQISDISNTLTSHYRGSPDGDGRPAVLIPEATKKGYAEATVGQSINLAVPNSKTRRGRVSDVAQTLDTGMQQHTLTSEMKIRRLTPTECERLQGFPDGWTEKGINEKGDEVVISDSQRYKTLGNAITTNVVTEIVKRLIV